ncbi:efflux RND transporter periplasmic adaptor subunit [Halovulum dunhuangense]|uniref:Efflux RND transporter periplasmic adaptor subunit n=1 Tax=Halovulum dunhuangense TaxID=1505036 RepID=A0A849L289_9RHOB|nr:efflux RND transporter periplasmic adaptor subunit [Halovulum dunhuangense]NNU80360.1 efflux RND transporter periplasmic adaptor subunit [Halovulum dunhuangense]
MSFAIGPRATLITLLATPVLVGAAAAQTFDCVIEPKSVATLSAPDEGTIEEIFVDRGQLVRAGQPLVRLEDAVQQLQLELAEAQARSDVEVRASAARLELRRKEYERARSLQERNVAAATTLEQAEIEVALSELSLEQATIARELAAIQERQARALLDRRTLNSPFDGVVTQLLATEGEYATEQAGILTLAQIDPLYVEVYLPAAYFSRIAPGQTHAVALAPPLEGRHEAVIDVVDPILDAASGTFGVRLVLPNPEGRIPAGARCLVELR